MGKIWMPGGGGAELDIITAGAGDVLERKVIIDKDGEPLTGTMPNLGTISQILNAGDSYAIPAGYHDGGGKVTANSLVSQTPATATPTQILSGQTAWVNGIKVTGGMDVQSILSFSTAVYSSTAIAFTWKNPVKGPFSGVIIIGKTGSYPTSIADGTRYYKGIGNNSTASGASTTIVSGFVDGITYYFKAFSYTIKGGAEWVSTTTYTATIAIIKGQQTFTSSGTFTVPNGVRSIDLFCVGGGGSGGAGGGVPNIPARTDGGGGGGGGRTTVLKGYTVTPGSVLTVTVGAGGSAVGGYNHEDFYVDGIAGSASSIKLGSTTVISATGGNGGINGGWLPNGGKGGSGGGGGMSSGPNTTTVAGGAGGTNGGSGGNGGFATLPAQTAVGGTGQGTTTRAFGEAANTLYAGGGGGGSYKLPGSSGAGGGGAGGTTAGGYSGTVSTGGGGGGTLDGKSGAGGTGIVIIRWGY